MRSLVTGLLLVALLAGVALLVARNRGDEEIIGVAAPDGSSARSLVVLDGAEGSASTVIEVLEPLDGASVPLDDLESVTFRWRALPGSPAYLFVANNEFGNLIWRGHSRDTTLVLPQKAAASLIRGDRVKWIVQVPKGSASSDLHRLEIR